MGPAARHPDDGQGIVQRRRAAEHLGQPAVEEDEGEQPLPLDQANPQSFWSLAAPLDDLALDYQPPPVVALAAKRILGMSPIFFAGATIGAGLFTFTVILVGLGVWSHDQMAPRSRSRRVAGVVLISKTPLAV